MAVPTHSPWPYPHTHRGRTHTPTVAVPTHSPWPYPHTHHGCTHQMGELTRIVHEMNALDELKQINTTGQRRDPLRPGGAPLASALESDARKLDLQPAKVAAALCSSLDLAPSAVVVDVGAGTGDHASQPASTARVPRVYGVSPLPTALAYARAQASSRSSLHRGCRRDASSRSRCVPTPSAPSTRAAAPPPTCSPCAWSQAPCPRCRTGPRPTSSSCAPPSHTRRARNPVHPARNPVPPACNPQPATLRTPHAPVRIRCDVFESIEAARREDLVRSLRAVLAPAGRLVVIERRALARPAPACPRLQPCASWPP